MKIEVKTNYLRIEPGMNMVQEMDVNIANKTVQTLEDEFLKSEDLKNSTKASKVIYTLTARVQGTPTVEIQYF